jgi:hypothetical protein
MIGGSGFPDTGQGRFSLPNTAYVAAFPREPHVTGTVRAPAHSLDKQLDRKEAHHG